MTVGEPDCAAQEAHLAAVEDKTIDLIRKSQLRVGQVAVDLCGRPEAGDLDDDIPFDAGHKAGRAAARPAFFFAAMQSRATPIRQPFFGPSD